MLTLRNEQDDLTFSLTTLGYKNKDEEWLNVRVDVSYGKNTFRKSGFYLEAVDVWTIADWFRALFKRRLPGEASLHFIKPNIGFHYIASSNTVTISIELGSGFDLGIEPQQFLPDSARDSHWRLKKIIDRGGHDPYDYKNQLYFEIQLQEFPGIIHNLKAAGYKYPPYRNLDRDDPDEN